MSLSVCPDSGTLRALLDDAVDDVEETELKRHLSVCSACQANLEYVAIEGSDQKLVPNGYVDEGTLISPALSDAMSRFCAGLSDEDGATVVDKVAADEAALGCLLSPSNSPDVFGRLGQYEVSKVLGQGGMGVVFLGTDPALHRPVAIKVLSPNLASNPLARARFIREARAQAAVNHPNLVTIYEVSELTEEDLPFLVMEFVEGESLLQVIRRKGHLSVEETARYGAEIASGLAAAHRAGVIHRDVKPANVLIDATTDTARITDFGLALVLNELDDRITRPGTIAGTPTFMSPEQVAEGEVDHRSDLFSLGTLLYLALTGESPFEGESHHHVLCRIVDADATALSQHQPSVPVWMQQIIGRLHQKAPGDRFQTATAVSDALRNRLTVPIQPLNSRPAGAMKWLGWVVAGLICFGVIFARMTGEKSSVASTAREYAARAELARSQQINHGLAGRPTAAEVASEDHESAKPKREFVVRERMELPAALRRGESNIVIDTDITFVTGRLPVNPRKTRIRAAKGRRPRLVASPQGHSRDALFDIPPGATLTLEGLELILPPRRRAMPEPTRFLIRAADATVFVSRCLLVAQSGDACIHISGSSNVQLDRCEISSRARAGIDWRPGTDAMVLLTNSTHDGELLCRVHLNGHHKRGAAVSIRDSNLDTPNVFVLVPDKSNEDSRPVELNVHGSVIANSAHGPRSLIRVVGPLDFRTPADSRQWLTESVRWTGRQNLYSSGLASGANAWFLRWDQTADRWQPRGRVEWERWWRIPRAARSYIGEVDYDGARPHPRNDSELKFGVNPTAVGPGSR